MKNGRNVKIIGTGSYIPTVVVPNSDFLNHEFYTPEGEKIETPNKEIIQKFEEITGIKERRYASDHMVASDLAYEAANNAIQSSGIDPESIDMIIVAHNYGDTKFGTKSPEFVPCLAARVKFKLGIKNPNCIAIDNNFGCPGWLQGVIDAYIHIKSEEKKCIMIIGAEILSRFCDPHDRNSLLFSDGAGAVILGSTKTNTPTGILAYVNRTDAHLLELIKNNLQSLKSDHEEYGPFLHMTGGGGKVYEYAISIVPQACKEVIEKAGLHLRNVSKLIIHQANGKMIEDILRLFLELYKIKIRRAREQSGERSYWVNGEDLENNLQPKVFKALIDVYQEKEEYRIDEIATVFMPRTINWLGNSSVATIPTLLDLILKGKLEGHTIEDGDYYVTTAVGAGMHANATITKK